MAEGSDTVPMRLTSRGVVRIPPRVRERYLGEVERKAIVQATGDYLDIRLWSTRENLLVRLPFDGYRAEGVYERAFTDGGVNVNRWMTPGKHTHDERLGWHNAASLEVGYLPEDGSDGVAAIVETFEGEDPR